MKRVIYFTVLLFLTLTAAAEGRIISLHGPWNVVLDPDSVGEQKGYFNPVVGSLPITLPGTLDEAGYGYKSEGADYGILSRRYKYIGPAWYTRQIEIPKKWDGQQVVLHLERVMWQSSVWIDGRHVSSEDGLGTPHFHHLGQLSPGKHTIAVRINNDMIYNIGDKGHSYGEYTQIIWNGMIGKIELRPVAEVSLSNIKLWPDATQKQVKITFNTKRPSSDRVKISYRLIDMADNREVAITTHGLTQGEQSGSFTETLQIASPIKEWDDRSPNLYRLELEVEGGDEESIEFGFRRVESSKSKILVNGRSVFMRGNLDCLHFPLTGYPSCDEQEWLRIFKIYKDHGLNQVRFHSWCPPEAAFAAADKLGIYIQAEVLWIDWWMSTINAERPEMTTRGLPAGLGHNPSADAFVPAEMRRMVDAYGNHPSFVMMCIGNELGNSDFGVMQKWISELKDSDNRRLYSASSARQITQADQYMVTHNIPGVGGTYGLVGSGTDFDLEGRYSKANLPIIAHELGQYPIYPLWSEIDKYSGVLEARNLMELRESARKNGLENMDKKFHQASGALQTLLYKANIEALLRTPSCAGFQMLSMTDYSGQGEALIGWLDSFWDSKGVVSAEQFSRYSADMVPLARFANYVWKGDEKFSAKVEVANYSGIEWNGEVAWRITDPNGEKHSDGNFVTALKSGELTSVGEIEADFSSVEKAGKYTLSLSLEGTNYTNEWSVWVYPTREAIAHGDVLIAKEFNAQVSERLAKGGKVLLLAHKLGREDDISPLSFTPLFWSNSFFPGQSIKTLGAYIDNSHPALADFPTDMHSDWQWQPISKGRAFILNNHPNLKSIVQPISDFHINDRLSSLWECRVGDGLLMVCGHDLEQESVVANQLKSSLLEYMNSRSFAPTYVMQHDELKELLYTAPRTERVVDQQFEDAVLLVSCGVKSTALGAVEWRKELDSVEVQQKQCAYAVSCDNVWCDESGTAWTGREIIIEIDTPNGVIGDLFVKFEDWNSQKRSGILSIEGRESVLEPNEGQSQWVKLFVMREDTNDGRITFKAKVNAGGNLMISRLAFVKQ